jgi:hypothetical protein
MFSLIKNTLIRFKNLRISSRNRILNEIKKEVYNVVKMSLGDRVGYGRFKGMVISTNGGWGGEQDRVTQQLGLYEKEVVEVISQLSSADRIFIDIGAANGYYAVGAALCLTYKKVIAYEMTDHGRNSIVLNSQLNGVSDKVEIKGCFDSKSISDLNGIIGCEDFVFLVDIEGGEYEVLSEHFFSSFKKSYVIVELHPWLVNNVDRISELFSSAKFTHNVTKIQNNGRDILNFPFFACIKEDYLCLSISENRDRPMEWVLFSPIL